MGEILKFAIELADGVSPAARKASDALRGLSTELKEGKANLASYQNESSSFAEMFGEVAAFGVAALAVKEVTSKVIELGISAIETALDVTALNEKLRATFDALGEQGPGSGQKTLDMLDALSTKLPQSRDKLAGWTKQIEATGVTDLGELKDQITAVASAQAIMGDEGAAAYVSITEKIRLAVEGNGKLKMEARGLKALYHAGANETDIAQKMGMSVAQLKAGLKAGTVDAKAFGDALEQTLLTKGKGPLEAMGTELGTIGTKATETFRHLFDDVDTAPLTDALLQLVSLGDAGDVTGKSLKQGITAGMNGIIAAVGHAIMKVEIFFLDLEIQWRLFHAQLAPTISLLQTIGLLSKPGTGGGSAKPGEKESGNTNRLGKAFSDFSWTSPIASTFKATGALFMSNLGQGIDGGVNEQIEKARKAGVDIGVAAKGGIQQSTESHSPSRVAFRLGAGMPQGMAMGMRSESHLPAREGRRMGGVALGGMTRAMFAESPTMGGRGGGGGTHIDHLEVSIQAPHGVTDAAAITVTGLTLALERIQLASGR